MNVSTDRVVLITGCSSGIGRATAERLARGGWTVYTTARREESLAELRAWSATACGRAQENSGPSEQVTSGRAGVVRVARLDVCDESSVREAVGQVEAEVGRLDAVINNAGYGQFGAVEETSDEEMRQQFEVNVVGPVRLIRAAVPVMRRQRCGRIVNVTSAAAHVTLPFMGVYSASKHALRSLSDALRVELRPWGIFVSQIEPGPVETEFQRNVKLAGGEASAYAEAGERAARARLAGQAKMAVPVERVARVIERCLNDRRPRARYPDTVVTAWTIRAAALLPDGLVERVVRKISGQ